MPWSIPHDHAHITSKGQVTLKKDLLKHLGIRPGDRVGVDRLPGGRIEVQAARPAGEIDAFMGLLSGKTRKTASIEEIGEAAARGWAGKAP